VHLLKQKHQLLYFATGKLAITLYCRNWSMGSVNWRRFIKRPVFSSSQPQNAAGSASTFHFHGNVMGLDLYVSNKAVATNIDESAFHCSAIISCDFMKHQHYNFQQML
jgi:hypothetical protein